MPPDFQAGAIVTALKANIEQFERGIAAAKKGITEFESGVTKAATGIQGATKKFNDTFTTLDRNAIKTTEKIAKFTQRLVGLQFAVSSIGNIAGTASSKVKPAIDALSTGLSVFAATVSILPNKIGLVTGAAAGLATGFMAAAGSAAEARKAILEEVSKINQELRQTSLQLEQFFAAPTRTREIMQTMGKELFPSAAEQAKAEFEILKGETESLLKFMQEVPQRLHDLTTQSLNEGTNQNRQPVLDAIEHRIMQLKDSIPEALKRLRNLGVDIDEVFFSKGKFEDVKKDFEARLMDLTKTGTVLVDAQALASLREYQDQMKKMQDSFNELRQLGKDALKEGLTTPLENAQAQAQLAKKNLEEVFKIVLALEKLSVTPGISKGTKEEILGVAESLKLPVDTTFRPAAKAANMQEFREETTLKIRKSMEEEAKRVAEALAKDAQQFGSAFGSALSDGILNARTSIEALANLGKNLFGNMVEKFVGQFETMMANAFTSIVGAGGELMSSILTGVAGIAGFLMMNKGGKENEEFADLSPAIESSQLVRGVVAGPQSVAIAEMGTNLRRAMVGVEGRLDVVIGVLTQIKNAGLGVPGGSGSPFAGTVPTS